MCFRFAHSLSLVRYFAFIAWGGDMRRFPQLILSLSHQGKATAMMAWRPFSLASRPSARPAARVLVSPLCSLFIVHPCRSKQDSGVVSRLHASLVLLLIKSPARCPLPHSIRSSVSFFVPSCVSSPVSFSCRPASSSRSHLIPSYRIAARLSASLAVAPFCSAHLIVLPTPCRHHRLMTG